MFSKISVLLVGLSVCFACKNEPKKEVAATPKVENTPLHNFDNPTAGNSSLARLFSDGEQLHMSWVQRQDSLATLYYATYRKGQWTEAQAINSGTDWFVNWADFPALAVNKSGVLTNYLQKSAKGTYTYDVKLNLFNAAENTWKKNFILHDDGTQSEHGFVSMRSYVDDSFIVVWLDGRETVGHDHGGGQMTLRAAIVFKDGSIQYDTLLDDRVCDCCQTSVAIGTNDEIVVAYRDRSEDEIRDISVVRWHMEGGWSKPMTLGQDNWKIPGCPVNGPSIDAFENNMVVGWFTAAKEEGDVNVAFSEDNGASFGPAYRIDIGDATGRVDVVMLNEEEAAVLWIEPKGDATVIQLMKINKNGYSEPAVTIAETSSERANGFPQLEVVGDRAYIAWTSVTGKEATINTASIALKDF